MRGRAGYVVAAAALAGGVGLAALILFQQLGGVADRLQQVVVPGEHEITLAQAGAHTIFHEERAVVGGRYFASDRQLNGLRLRLQSMPDGKEIEIEPPSARTSYALADREGSSIAMFNIPHPGTYRLSGWYPETASDTTAVLAIGQGVERRLMAAIFGSLAAALGGLLACIALAGATFMRRRRDKQARADGRIVEEVHVKARILGTAFALLISGQAFAQDTQPASRLPLASVESRVYNQTLSEQRAASVKQWLVANGQVNGANIATRGWGKSKPVTPNTKPDGSDDPEGRAKNRRVEIVVSRWLGGALMLGDTAARRRARRVLGPWLLAGVGVWLAFDNAPALIEEWRLGGAGATGTATVLSMEGGRPSRASRRLWDDFFWGRGRRVTYQFAPRDGESTSEVAFVTHGGAEALQQGGPVRVRYLAADPAVHRIDGEPGVLLLSFRLLVGLALTLLCIFLLRGKRSRSEPQPGSSRRSA